MKALTKAEKLKILKLARMRVKEGWGTLCWALDDALIATGIVDRYYAINNRNCLPVPEHFGLVPPRKRFDEIYWWAPSNYTSRLRCIDRAIARLTTKKRTNK